jgi:DNA mismatch repair protein MutL
MIIPMAKIRVLNDRLINKIAAGEVVERPASALKELIENALDAGARELRIDLEAGGKRLIRVVDDGEGMDSDDVLMALERHATSKIRDFEDLEEVGSLGFRGEALPSIAAVSRLTLRSRPAGSAEGREVRVEGGVIKDVRPCAMAPGTSVEAASLFFNVPARRKFLRTTATEFGHCQEVAIHYALAFPEVKFSMRHDGAAQIEAPPAASLRDRILQVLGDSLLQRLIPFELSEGEIEILGFAGEPALHRTNTAMMHFFVNRRAVRDKVLIHAVRSAYDDLLPKQHAPVAFLFIDLPAREIDVNVHPAKAEIRFRNSTLVHDMVSNAVRRALARFRPLDSFGKKEEPDKSFASARAPRGTLESLDAALKRRQRPGARKMDFRDLSGGRIIERTEAPAPIAADDEAAGKEIQLADTAEQETAATTPVEPVRIDAEKIDAEEVVPLGQIRNSFIVARFGGGLMIIDQHAAHERILFEKLLGALDRGEPEVQRLLHPAIIELPPAQARLLEQHAADFAALGFEIEPFGPGTVALRSLPASIDPAKAEEMVAGMAADLERMGGMSPEKLRKELVVSASCQEAIKINTQLTKEKMHWLIDELFKCELPMRCPHGRPVVLTFGEDELRRRFGRS